MKNTTYCHRRLKKIAFAMLYTGTYSSDAKSLNETIRYIPIGKGIIEELTSSIMPSHRFKLKRVLALVSFSSKILYEVA